MRMLATQNPKKPKHTKNKHPIALAFQDPQAHSLGGAVAGLRTKELAWRQQHSQSEVYPFTSAISSNHTLSLSIKQQQCGEQVGIGTGAVVWNAAHVLASFLTKQARLGNNIFSGRSVVDLGTGTGLTGLVACGLGAREVTFTDIGPVLELTKANVELNLPTLPNPPPPMTVVEYWWGSETLPASAFDIVLAADCILPKLYPIKPLVSAISHLLSSSGVCYVSYEHRVWFEFDPPTRFREFCTEMGLSVKLVQEKDLDEKFVGEDITVWEIRKVEKYCCESPPTLQQFNSYHSMLCHPRTAKLCTSYFTSTSPAPKIVFVRKNQMPYRGYGFTGDYTARLTWWWYYGLVVYSFTGLSTALGLTECSDCSESLSDGLSNFPPKYLITYLSDGDKTKVIRHFSYNFRLPGIVVDMWHVRGEKAVHLVEVYRGGYRGIAILAAAIAAGIVAGVGRIKKTK